MTPFADFARQLAFATIQPLDPLPPDYQAMHLTTSVNEDQIRNTDFAEDKAAIIGALWPILSTPRMSTVAIGGLLQRAVAQMDSAAAYVNVGVWHGFSLLAGMAGNPDRSCIGVDNFSLFGGPRDVFLTRFQQHRSPKHDFFEMDYARYLEQVHVVPIGVYFYDGAHDYAAQLAGLHLAEPFFTRNVIIFVDDANLAAPREATQEFLRSSRRSYVIIRDDRTAANGHPTLWNGLMILQGQDSLARS